MKAAIIGAMEEEVALLRENIVNPKLQSIGLATAGTFSLLPSDNASGNYTKEVQVIPVKVSIENYGGLDLVPGMNVTVRIHK